MESKGLGDSIEKVTKVTGLKSFMDLSMGLVGKKDCGCNKRKQWLNKKVPYNNN
tara:strand:- start:14587 stop:14748 length:162 start_codon:yes stop_codon:yes gene_type:complete